ncbi:MAG: 5'-nucleotidase C-terminal domain-containing protein, partial [Acetivibrio sp.]
MKSKKKIIIIILAILLITDMVPKGKYVKAEETATVRIISTTDLHGQLANVNYDTAGERSVGSLAQAYSLIKEAREEVKKGTSITVDAGDTIYGYGSNIVSGNDGSDYMYSVMAKMGYDALILGNHDFDYGYDYVKDQLNKAGLFNKCVMSNVFDAVTGENIGDENKIITKTLTTSKGKKINVKIGIIGVTRPSLTTYYNHKGILTTKDILESTEEQVEKLKSKGSDVIVAVAHSGIGPVNPSEMAGDVSYALSKIEGVDAVMCGHAHLNFPSGNPKVQKYYDYPNVVRSTGLMNGKPVVMVADRGVGVGIADLKLQIDNGKIKVVGSKAAIKYARKETVQDPIILKYQEAYDQEIKKTYSEEVGELEDGKSITNYFGLLSDNTSIQLVNEAKIQLGLEYTNLKNPEYKDYPVIAVSNYKKYGLESKDDYVNVSGKITMGDILGIQSYYHDYAYIYWITGKQLRDWLEWTASAYAVAGSRSKTGDEVMDGYISQMKMESLIKKDWLSNWSNFGMFDGIEYEIDITNPPKYSLKGDIINQGSFRITNLSYNGEPIKEDMKLILVSDIITPTKTIVGNELSKQRIYKGTEYSANLLKNYIKDQSKFGKIYTKADDNWKVTIPASENYLVRSSADSEDIAKQQSWYQETLEIRNNYAYYKASFTEEEKKDTDSPLLVVAPLIKIRTDKEIPVAVQANDISGIRTLKYAKGKLTEEDMAWMNSLSTTIQDGEFYVKENGVYSILAIDNQGNKRINYIEIKNIDPQALQIPEINRITNKTASISGIGEPEAGITIEIDGKTYKTQADENGAFLCKIKYPYADSLVRIKQQKGGRESDYVELTVLRAGPNFPIVDPITNKTNKITANMKDRTSQIVAIANEKTVYVGENGGKKLFMSSSRYNAAYDIIETKFTKDGNKAALSIPVPLTGTKMKVFSMDHIGRVNYPINFKVKEVAPEMPIFYKVCDGEQYVYGYIPAAREIEYPVTVTVGENQYYGTSDTSGKFIVKVADLKAGETIYAKVSDEVNGKKRESASGKIQVDS